MRSGRSRWRACATASASVIAAALALDPARAQTASASAPAAAPTQSVGEVVVTGSRIAKRDFSSNSPIVTVNAAAFQNTSNVAVEATLNKLPQFTPDQDLTGVNSEDVQPTATHTVGISTASLRGLGANRNLVLADGQRLQPVNGSLVVDLNSIPSAIIDHVEVVTGGASAVYGADAVAGVVNFILKKNYQGMDVDAQWGAAQAGDGQEFKISTLFGANFADDKGNVTFSLEHYTRAASYEKNRSFYTNGWADPTTGTNEFFNTGAYFYGITTPATSAAVQSATGVPTSVGGAFDGYAIFGINANGTLSDGAFGSPGSLGQVYNYTGAIDGQHVAYEDYVSPSGKIIQGIKTNQVDDYYITSPLNRWSMYGAAHYDINENLTAYVRGTFESIHTATNLFPTPFISGWTTYIPYNPTTDDPSSAGYTANGTAAAVAADAHPVSQGLATLLDNQLSGKAASQWEIWLIPTSNSGSWMPPRSTIDDNNVWQMTAGLQGKLPVNDWTWEAYGSHGQAADYTQGDGYVSLQRLETILDAPDYGYDWTSNGNNTAANNGFGVAQAHCTSGFYGAIFEGTKPSQDCINAITATLQSRTLEEQNIVEFDTQGTLFHAPAGDVKLSLGADYRDESVQYTPDILQSTSSFIDQVAGVYPTAYEDASTSAREGYGELAVPVVKDLPFVKQFDLELGARYSTYTAVNNLTGEHITPPGGWTYKILGDWQVNDWMRFRGGYNLAIRSPNVGELFLGKQEVYAAGGQTAYGDPCSLASDAPFGAGGAAKDPVTGASYAVTNSKGAAGAQSAYLICQALMGSAGASYYYGGSRTAQAAPAPTTFGFVEQEGNTNLSAEKAHTWTAGMVLSSPWRDNPWIGALHGSIDYYDIKIDDAIEFESVDQVKAACYGQTATDAAEAATIAASAPCQLVKRLQGTGQEDTTTVEYSNLATIWTSGIDVEVDDAWNFDSIGLHQVPGRIMLNVLLNYLSDYDTTAYAGATKYHWAGTLGPSLTGVDQGSAFRWKLNTTVTYAEGPFSVSLNWRFLPHTHSANYPLYQSQPGGLGACGNTPTYQVNGVTYDGVNCTKDTNAYHVFDLSMTYTFRRNYEIRAGIDNLFNTQPPTTAATTGIGLQSDGTYVAGGTLASDGAGSTLANVYDTLGRRFYVGINARF